MNADPIRKGKTIDGLQYLRGIAAIMVVFHHSRHYFGDVANWTDIGARGVDIFFVISGFIMAYATRHGGDNATAAKASLIFLSKRFIRVAPLYWVAILWASSSYWIAWLVSSNSPRELYWNISPELISIGKDLVFIPHASISEPQHVYPILIPGWTINYEIFFYFIFGISMLFRQYRLVSAFIIITTLVALGQIFNFNNVIGKFYTSEILLEFVFGMIVFEVYLKTHHLPLNRMVVAFLGAFGFYLLHIGSGLNERLILATASAIVVWFFIHAFRGIHNGPLKLLGDASYSIYLFHLTSFALARELIDWFALSPDGYLNVVFIIALHMLMAAIMGIAVYYTIERPLLEALRHALGKIVSLWKRNNVEPVTQ